MRKKIGRMLSVLLASATFLSGSYIPVSASSPFTTTATSGTDKSSSKEATASTTDDSSGTAKTNLNAMTLSSDTEEVVSSSGSDDNTGSVVVDSATISTFDDRFDKKTYPLAKAPSKEKVIAELPETLSVTTTDGDQVSVPVQSWDSDDYKNSAIGDYTFTPALSDAYQYSLASSIPWIDVSVTKNKVTDISTSFEDEMCALADAPEVDVIKEDLPTELEATVNDENSTIKILSWDTDYDCTRAGVYTFTPVINEEIYELDGTSIPYEVITVYADESNGISLAVEGKVTSIGAFVAQVASGATKQANGDYVWTAPNDSKGHQFVFRINYSTSGQGTVSGNLDGSNSAWKITIPKTILKDKGGSRADTCELSIPSRDELSDFSEQEMKEAIGFAYYEDGGNLVIYNFRDLDAAQNGYIEVAYVTSDRTYNYLDYGATGAASSPFYATMQVSGLSATTEKIPVYINTTASVNATYKYYPVQSSAWRSTWGEKPSDADDYVWQRWEIRTDITDDPTQTYDFILTDEVTCNEVPVEVYGYQFSGSSSISETNKVSNIRSYDGYRYDYVFTRVKKTDRDKVTSYTLHNKITATVHPVDGVDADTNAVSTRDFSWTLPVFIHPNGHFYTWKYGNENWTNLFGSWYGTEWDYASYDLDKFQESKITSLDNIKYAIWAYGFPFPWTLKDGGSSDNWQDYGYKNVTYQVTDEAFYNLNSDGTYGADSQKFNPDYTNGWESEVAPGEDGSPLTPRMDPEDYDISYISLAAYFRDVPRDSEGHLSEDAGSIDENLEFNIQTISPTSKDVLELYTKSGTGDYVKAGELNLGTGKYTIVQDGLIKSITRDSYYRGSRGDWRINFKDGVDGFRVKTSNNHYYTDLKIYPYISIKNTERMLNWTGTGNITSTSSTAKDAVLVRNVSNLQVFDSSNNTILDLTKTAGDRLRRTEKTSEISKKVTGVSNSARKKTFSITWRVNANETATTGNGDDSDSTFIPQTSGTFYDLLPAGSLIDKSSVMVAIPTGTQTPAHYKNYKDETYLSENSYTVETIDNYKNSGRTMLIVRVKDTGSCYTVYYTTTHPWDSIADYGNAVKNPVAYETGNDEISGGFPDDPTAANLDGLTMDQVQASRSNSQLSAANRTLFKNLDADTDGYKFIYDEADHNINAITAALSGLNKRVKANDDSAWSYDTIVSPDGTYAYRLRFSNTMINATKDLILYDSIENYYLTDGAEKGQSAWYGKLTSIDTSQMAQVKSSDMKGNEKTTTLNPVVYVSTVSGLDLDVKANKDLTNSSIWQKLTSSTDLSKVKAIAYDLRKDSAGDDFILKPGGSISSVLYMAAPHTITDNATKQYPETYNNVYLDDTVIGYDLSLTPYSIHYDYTTVKYAVTANFGIHKVSANDTSQAIKDISFRLYGTSDYGTEVNQIIATDKNGDISFKKIEKGTYILQEYSGTPDWLEDHTEHKVIIDGNGKVTIDGTDYTDKSITITNKPRVHADVEFLKRQDGKTNVFVNGATFMLSGTSYYGNDILMYATSESGRIIFENVERGTYTIQETKAPDGYIKSTKKYTMTVDESGNVSFAGMEANKQGLYTVLNEKLHNFTVIKRSSYDNSPLADVQFHLTGTSDYGTKVDMTATSAENGFAGFTKLEAGTYILQETKTAEHHQLDTTKRVVRIDSDNTITISGLNQSTTDKTAFIWINERVPDEQVTVIKEWVGDTPDFTEDNLPTIHLVADGADYNPKKAYFAMATKTMLDDNKAVSFARNTSLTEDEVKAISGVKRIDITADQEKAFGRIYGWVEGDNFYWWSNCEYGCLTDDTREIFNDLSNLTQMDLKYVDTSEMTNMNSMFANDENLTTLTNIEDFDTSHVTNMERMFYRCGVQTLDLTTWDVSNVESFSYMFANTSNFQELDITGWDMSGCKYYCKTKGKYGTMEFGSNSSNYEGEYVGGYKGEAFYYAGDQKNGFHVIANNVTFPGDSNMMFWNSYVSQIDMENVDLSQVVTMHWFLGSCGKLKEVSISNATDTKNLRYINYCFDSCSNLTNVTLSGFDTSENLLNASYMFKFDSALTSLTQDLNTQSARILNSMFYYCRNITELDLSNFDTSSIGKADDLNETYTGGLALMVIGCSQLKKLNISNWDLSSTTGKLEYDKNGIITYGTNDFITSIGDPYATDLIVTANNMVLPECVGSLFYDLGPAQVEMNNTDFSHVVYLGSLFHGSYSNNTKLKKFDISGFGAKNIKTLKYTFGCMPNVKALDLTWLESAPTNTTSMFEGDSSLTTIYVSKNFDMSKVNISSDMFYNCSSLKNFDSTKTDATNANTSSTGYFTLKE